MSSARLRRIFSPFISLKRPGPVTVLQPHVWQATRPSCITRRSRAMCLSRQAMSGKADFGTGIDRAAAAQAG